MRSKTRSAPHLDEVDAGYARLRAASSDSVGNAFRVEVAERLETQHRINRGQMYRFFGEIIEPPDGADDPDLPAGTVMAKLLWQRLRITTADIQRRMATAARIRPRRTLTGPELPPELPRLAAAVENGDVDDDHIDAVCKASTHCPRLSVTPKETCANEYWSVTPKNRTPRSSRDSPATSPNTSTLTRSSTSRTAPDTVD